MHNWTAADCKESGQYLDDWLGNFNPCQDQAKFCTKDYDYDCSYCDLSFCDITTQKWVTKPSWQISAQLIGLGFICVAGLLGNLSIIVIILKNRLLRLQPNNLFLLNMAIADFCMLLFIPTLYFFKQIVIFRFYYLGEVACYATPYLIVAFFAAGSGSLSLITLARLIGIGVESFSLNNLKCRTACGILLALWLFALGSAFPTTLYRRYWKRYWSDLVEINCDDDANPFDDKSRSNRTFDLYWLLLISVTVWIPSLIMLSSFGFLFYKLKRSVRMFPYLSEQSRVVRIRSQVIRMLFVLMLFNLVCWAPWQAYTMFYQKDEAKPLTNDEREAQQIFHDVKFYLIFFNCAVNPYIYGYWNSNMRKAFRLTYPWIFGNQPKYVLQRDYGSRLTVTFRKIVVETIQRGGAATTAAAASKAAAAAASTSTTACTERQQLGLEMSTINNPGRNQMKQPYLFRASQTLEEVTQDTDKIERDRDRGNKDEVIMTTTTAGSSSDDSATKKIWLVSDEYYNSLKSDSTIKVSGAAAAAAAAAAAGAEGKPKNKPDISTTVEKIVTTTSSSSEIIGGGNIEVNCKVDIHLNVHIGDTSSAVTNNKSSNSDERGCAKSSHNKSDERGSCSSSHYDQKLETWTAACNALQNRNYIKNRNKSF